MTEKQRQILIFGNSYSLTNHLLKTFVELANETIELTGQFNIALSGGQTPIEFYCRLSNLKDFDLWRRTHVFLTDERFVSVEDKESNFKLIKDNLFNYVDIPQSNIHPIRTDLETVGEATEDYKNQLMSFFEIQDGNKLPRFDFMLLGIGSDGHTASIFPDEQDIDNPRRLTLAAQRDYLKYDRVSLSLSVINNTRHLYFLGVGDSKAQVVREIIEQKASYPAAQVKPIDGKLTFLLDRHAAHELTIKEDEFSHLDEAISILR